jgi:hypothetical protein
MPTADDKSREIMKQRFGDIDLMGPLQHLLAQGFSERGGMITPPYRGYKCMPGEWDCIGFLCDEWDFAYDPSLAPEQDK